MHLVGHEPRKEEEQYEKVQHDMGRRGETPDR
jgi:hypothetical protein